MRSPTMIVVTFVGTVGTSGRIVILLIRAGSEDDAFMTLWTWKKENLPSLSHAVRTTVAATISILLGRLVGLPEAYWAAIATVVVMQSPVGTTVALAVERIIASALGASVGAIEATYFGANLL